MVLRSSTTFGGILMEKRQRLYILTSMLALTMSVFNLVLASDMRELDQEDSLIYISADDRMNFENNFYSPAAEADDDDHIQKVGREDSGLTGI